MKIVSNATPIISLCSIGQVDLLKKLFGKILIPKAVYSEQKHWKLQGKWHAKFWNQKRKNRLCGLSETGLNLLFLKIKRG